MVSHGLIFPKNYSVSVVLSEFLLSETELRLRSPHCNAFY